MFKRIFMLALALVLVGPAVFAQQTNARIIGTVTDPDGNPLPGVAVEATSPKLVGKAAAVTDENGVYRLLNLVPGVYSLAYELEGFNRLVREGIALSLEQTLSLNVALKLGIIKESVVVTGQAPLIDVKSTARGMTLSKESFQTLPKGRDFSSLVTMIPGVNYEYLQGASGGISVDGASGAENMYYTDGMDTGDVRGGDETHRIAFDFVDEVQVKASGYNAEFGGSMGGVINVVTRSGGNEFSGDLIGYYGNQAGWIANTGRGGDVYGGFLSGHHRDNLRINPDDESQAEYVNFGDDKVDNFELGLSLGGYVVKDKLWFFASVLPSFQRLTRSAQFDADPSQNRDVTINHRFYNFQGKLTANPTKNLRMSVAFVNNEGIEDGILPLRDGSSNPDYDYGQFGFHYPQWSASGSADLTVGNNLMVSVRGGYFFQNTNQQRLKVDEPLWQSRNSTPAGTPADLVRPGGWMSYTMDDGYTTKYQKYSRLNASGDLNCFVNLAGEHSLKAGVQFVRVMDNIDARFEYPWVRFNWNRTYAFVDGVRTARGTYGYYEVRQPFGKYVNKAVSNRLSVYLQDSWTIGNRFTLNFGLRAESEKVPAFSDLPAYKGKVPLNFGLFDKLAPRLGFTYDVFGDSSLKLYGSFGIFQDCMKLALPEGSYGGDVWISRYYTLDTLQWNQIGVDGSLPGTYLEELNWRIPAIDITDPDIKPYSQREISFGLEKRLAGDLAFSARLVNKKLLRAIEDIGIQMPEGETYFIANPGSAYVQTRFDEAKAAGLLPANMPPATRATRDYWGVNLALEKRFADNWTGGINYTWSRLSGNYAGLNSAEEANRNDPNVNRYWDLWWTSFDEHMNPQNGVLPTDRTHQFKAYGSYRLPFGLTVGAVANGYSGTPISTEFLMNGQQGYYPAGRFDTGKRTPFVFFANVYAEYNLRLGKKNNLQISLNVDNVTNARTARRVWNTINRDNPYLSDAEILAGFDYTTLLDPEQLDPRYLMGIDFLPPIMGRLGFKLSF